MNNLFGNGGCGFNNKSGGKLFNFGGNSCDNDCEEKNSCGFGGCSAILLILMLTSCCGCEIDWCNIIVLYLLLTMC
jgi:hypothetical protein